MKRFIKTALTVVLAVAAVSCAKEIELQKENINGTIDLTITGAINGYTPQEETKAEAQTVVRIMWKGGEKVYVFDGTECLGFLTASIEDTDGTYAKLSGTISATQATTLTFVYSPQFTAQPTVTEGKISLDLSTQNGEEVPFLIYATMPTAQAPASFTNEVVQFNLATSVFKCNCSGLGEDGEISKAAISGVNTKCELTLSASGVPTVNGTTLGTITRTAGFKADDQRAIFSVALPKTDESAQDRTIEVTKGRKKFTASYPKKAFDVSKSFNSVFAFEELVVIPTEALTAGVFSVSPTKKVYFSPGNLYAKKEGEIWSWHFYNEQYMYYESYNIDEEGNKIATADDNQIDLFTWGFGSWSTNPITKEYGSTFTDWGTGMGDDNTWYTLSSAEWQYLFSWEGDPNYTNDTREGLYAYGVTVCGKTNCIILYPDGFAGTKVENGDTSSYDTEEEWTAAENAGVVCLPAAGLRNDGEGIYHYGRHINYWSSTLYENGYACGVITFNTDFNPDYDDISCMLGCSVRLVADAPELPEVPVESISLSKTELELIEGLSESLTVTFTPAEPTKKAVFWSSDNTSVATVDQTGKVSAVSVGTATITAVADGLAKASCAVTVSGLPNNVIIYKAAEKLEDFDPEAFADNSIYSHTFTDGVGIITFENDVVSIGEYAFYECAMTYVGIPASVKEIGYEAFYECEELEQVFIAGGSELKTIGEEAFCGSALTSFNIPASVTTIDKAFWGCENLTKVTFANDCAITSIGVGAFGGCGFTSITIPASVTTIGVNAFYGSALTSINISASVTEIGDSAFEGCNSLAEVTFADDCNITSIGIGVFAGCGFTSITIPATVTTIGESAFSYSALTSVNIPSSVTVIGEQAFYGCEDLTTVTFADNSQFTEIGYRTFYQSGLTSINIPASVKEIGEEAFYECEDLATLTFADNSQLTKIGAEVFFGSGLTSIKIPALVTEIGGYAFGNCEDLATVTFASGSQLSTIDILFDGSGLKSITIPASVTEIKDEAFKQLSKLTTVTFENNSRLTKIGESVFYQSGLISINIPASVTEIGEYAFYECEDLATVTFEDNSKLTQIGVQSFEGSGLTSVNIPTLVTEIGNYAFEDCEKLATVTFEDNSQLTEIGAGSFRRSGLKSVNIPLSVTTISEYAFCECESLDVIKVNWTSAELIPLIKNKGVFDGVVPSNRKLYVPSGMVETYKNADKGWNDVALGTITDGNAD